MSDDQLNIKGFAVFIPFGQTIQKASVEDRGEQVTFIKLP